MTYREIMNLGFKEEFLSDSIFFDQHGFDYTIITKKMTKTIFLSWHKETKRAWLVHIDSPKTGNIIGKIPVTSLQQMESIIKFFSK